MNIIESLLIDMNFHINQIAYFATLCNHYWRFSYWSELQSLLHSSNNCSNNVASFGYKYKRLLWYEITLSKNSFMHTKFVNCWSLIKTIVSVACNNQERIVVMLTYQYITWSRLFVIICSRDWHKKSIECRVQAVFVLRNSFANDVKKCNI